MLAKRVDTGPIHENPLSSHAVSLVRHWMAKCERKHTACFDHPTTLPTRVVDVRGSMLRLLDPSPLGPHQYIALSHCWGTCRSFLTTRGNLEDRKRGFLLQELPATFQDAIEVTRRLDVPYLWIDSICILQGDQEDWEIEGSKMADVYANATLTIAAANASDDAEGFLKPRPRPPTLTIDISLSHTNGTSTGDSTTTRIYTRLPVEPKLLFPPLDGRAWCLQEQYLSPRVLWFGSDDLCWGCLGAGWFEDGRRLPKRKLQLQLPDVLPAVLEDGTLSHTRWYRMVELYTTRAITYAGDKLPALSALASRVAQRSGDQYLAGSWRGDIFGGLLWYRQVRTSFRDGEPEAPFRGLARCAEPTYIAPTWSWASYHGAVGFVATFLETTPKVLPSASVIDASVTVPGKDPFGQVQSGFLLLGAELLSFEPAEFDEEDPAVGSWLRNRMWCLEIEDPDVDVVTTLDYHDEHASGYLMGVPLLYSKRADVGRTNTPTDNLLECTDESANKARKPVHVYGILLKAVGNGQESLFERVGAFEIRSIRLCDVNELLQNVGKSEIKII
ncbi:HET-domain-containing protein [Lophiostoma macrostomum CBS 122681]|uniref:HET-domain-containing protein n=1 Tax=Lophiostoma macrostomum CBS 122681 TaxID=1314788 RepID=A0A6A6TLX1_9PLEO|nr:HET-domain-containing protein [Lophiostoma macrostomum CBS 122681]